MLHLGAILANYWICEEEKDDFDWVKGTIFLFGRGGCWGRLKIGGMIGYAVSSHHPARVWRRKITRGNERFLNKWILILDASHRGCKSLIASWNKATKNGMNISLDFFWKSSNQIV